MTNGNWIQNNLPTVLTGVSVVTGALTVGYSVWAGFKIHEKITELPSDCDTMDKIKVAAPYLVPVAVGFTVASACAIGANKENGKRLAAAGVTIAALSADKKDLMDKTKEFLGKDENGKVDQEKGEEEFKKIQGAVDEERAKKMAAATGMASAHQLTTVHDLTTGYVWKTTLKDLYGAISDFNNVNQIEHQPISYFYEQSYTSGMVYPDLESIYDDIYVDEYFNPEIDYEPGPDMQPILTIKWDSQRAKAIPMNKCGGYVY